MNKKIILISFLIIVLDQSSKFLVKNLSFDIVLNSGVSLNLLSYFSRYLLISILLSFILFIFFLFKENWRRNPFATGLFFGGAVSNIVDRILYSGVRDWLKVPFLEIKNNLADWAIFLGLIIVFISLLKTKRAV